MGLIIGFLLTIVVISIAFMSMAILIAIGVIGIGFVLFVKLGLMIGLSAVFASYFAVILSGMIGIALIVNDAN